MSRLLGVDPGLRWVGLALTDQSGLIATPWGVVDRRKDSLRRTLETVIEDEDVAKVIVGYPTPLRAEENERTRQVDDFLEHFIEPLPIPHDTISERYSTREATRLREQRGQAGEGTDAEAAAMILEYYLESRGQDSDSSEGGSS